MCIRLPISNHRTMTCICVGVFERNNQIMTCVICVCERSPDYDVYYMFVFVCLCVCEQERKRAPSRGLDCAGGENSGVIIGLGWHRGSEERIELPRHYLLSSALVLLPAQSKFSFAHFRFCQILVAVYASYASHWINEFSIFPSFL